MNSTFLPLFSRIAVAATICALPASSLLAQAPATPAPAVKPLAPSATPAEKPKPLQETDKMYVRTAAKSMNYLIQLCNAAKSGIPDPASPFARLRDSSTPDLTKALEALMKIAEAHGEKIPTDVAGTEKVDLDRLGKAKPDKFPKEWVEAVFKEAKRLDHETEMAGKTLQDADLKTFVSNYGPSIHTVFSSADAAEKAAKKMK